MKKEKRKAQGSAVKRRSAAGEKCMKITITA